MKVLLKDRGPNEGRSLRRCWRRTQLQLPRRSV
ncbi:hypothetical protein Hamer_G004529 [Homarus americanus]|uniref:Uncharacterized protein n=1 Tax=Homarus americanus TaxID=6706 RepID=A0A8J5JW23_HOMAM|nr:hypothetical protein Hamer_G004529 [Homarus americanus]